METDCQQAGSYPIRGVSVGWMSSFTSTTAPHGGSPPGGSIKRDPPYVATQSCVVFKALAGRRPVFLSAAQRCQFALDQALVAQVEFHQAAQVADGFNIYIETAEAQLLVMAAHQLHVHTDLHVGTQRETGLKRVLFYTAPVGRRLDQKPFERDVQQLDLPGVVV